MAKTLLQLQTALAYRLGENAAPESAAELTRRKSFLNEAYDDIMREHYWWFTEATDTFNSVANQASYTTADGVASDLRAILELRVSGTLYDPITQAEAMSELTYPYTGFSQSYFVFAGSIYFVPVLTTSTADAVAMKYYKNHTELSSNTDTTLIPDMFVGALVSFAYGRVMGINGQRGSAGDGYAEFEKTKRLMNEEQNKYLLSLKASSNELQALYP